MPAAIFSHASCRRQKHVRLSHKSTSSLVNGIFVIESLVSSPSRTAQAEQLTRSRMMSSRMTQAEQLTRSRLMSSRMTQAERSPGQRMMSLRRTQTEQLTRSRMMSAVPMRGAASSAPSALNSTTCSKPCSSKYRLAMLWYPVTTLRGVLSVQSFMLQATVKQTLNQAIDQSSHCACTQKKKYC